MAYASWVTPNKTSGSGNDTVSWTGTAHTGRTARTTTASFNASGVESKTLTINQAGKTEFVTIPAETATVAKTGGTVTITGTSNSSKLTFSLSNNNIGLAAVTTYVANSASATSGTAIAGDPGATQEYTFSVTFSNIGANTGSSPRTSQLTVTDNAGHTDTITISQTAGDASLSISPTTINLTAAGVADSAVTVTSNTNWTIS
jgi:hypothetical protein